MAGAVFTSSIAKSLKKTLNTIVDDKKNNNRSRLIAPKWVKMGSMEDQFVDDVEYAGGGLVAVKPEGGELQPIVMKEGATTRYLAQTFGAVMNISEEADEDAKYPEVIDLAMRLDRSMYKTIDTDITLVLARATDANFIGGDAVSLASTAHPLPASGTFSNTLVTPMSPSPELVSVVWSTLAVLPGHDGNIEGYDIEKVVYPPAQHFAWLTVLKSKLNPEAGNFAAVNIVNSGLDYEIQPVCNKYWQNTTTNCGFITSADNGIQFKYRRKPTGRSWVDNNTQVMKFSITARWSRLWSDPRGYFHNNL